MTIQNLIISKLYGFLNKDIKFQEGVSILVGINGSGKTSILNIINWLLRPAIPELCLIEFESLTLLFKYENEEYQIRCEQNKIELTIELINLTNGKKYNKIQATFTQHPKKLTKNETLKSAMREQECYDGLSPEEHEKATWNFIFNKLPKPVVIGLDRSLYTKEGEDFRFEPPQTIKARRNLTRETGTLKTPLDRARELINEEHNTYGNGVLSLYQTLSEKIMLSTFDEIQTADKIAKLLKAPPPTKQQLDTLELQVLDFLKESSRAHKGKHAKKQNDPLTKIQSHFTALRKLATFKAGKDNLLYLANINQFIKINSLVEEFDTFEREMRRLHEPIKIFLGTINKFLADSAKEIYYDKESFSVKFRILGKDNAIIDEGRDIVNLSSGEKQLLILLTYLKHLSRKNIFIIDEPELSLHPKWQLEFLQAVEALMPAGAQLILATHSPEIIGDRKNQCTVLLPYNNN